MKIGVSRIMAAILSSVPRDELGWEVVELPKCAKCKRTNHTKTPYCDKCQSKERFRK